jgi:hypothetical protein
MICKNKIMPTLTVIERTERIYQVALTEEQYILAEKGGEGWNEVYEEMCGKLELVETKEGPNSRFILTDDKIK